MAVDYISALNAGSGLNTTQIIDSLIDAERAPREAIIQEKIDSADVAISSIGLLKTELNTFNTNVSALDGQNGITLASSSSSIGVTKTGTEPLSEFNHSIEVSALAQQQVIQFSGFSTAADAVSLGTLTFTVGTWDANVTSFSANSDYSAYSLDVSSASTIADVVTLINNDTNATINGIQASILQTGTGAYSLVIKSHYGADRELSIVDSAGSTFEFSSNSDASHQVSSGADASLTVDGISVTRNSNIITDLIDDMTVTISAVTTSEQTISAVYDETSALATMQTFVEELNFVLAFLKVQTTFGQDDEEDGGLAGDAFGEQLYSYVRGLTTNAITGFGATDVYLSYFGVQTNRDGTLTLNTDTFKTYFAQAPDDFSAIAQSRATSSNSAISASIVGNNYTPGSYTAAINSSSSGTITDTEGTSTTLSYASDTNTFVTPSGNAAGLNLVSASSSTTATIYIGRSLTETMTDYFTTILETSGDIDDKLDLLADAKDDYAAEIEDLDERIAAQRAVYVEMFSAMEGAVSSFKSTGDYITNFMDGWRAGLG